MDEPCLKMRFLGGMQFSFNGQIISDHLAAKALALACFLVETGEAHSRCSLAALLWSDFSEHRARSNLRDTVAVLRRAGLEPFLDITRRTIGFYVKSPYWLDTSAFQESVELGCAALPADSSLLERAILLYAGDFLAGFQVAKAALFEEWLVVHRQQLRLLATEAMQRLVDHHLEAGSYDVGIEYALRLLELDPWSEAAHRSLILMQMLIGDYHAAVRQYEHCRQLLDDELGVAPSTKTQTLYQNLRRHIGDDRTAKHIRLASDRVARPGTVPHNLPSQVTPFIGRQREQRAIDNALADRSARLLTIFGVGGSGKTRLALAIAEKQILAIRRDGDYRFVDGVFFVALQAFESPADIVPAICQTIGFQPADETRDGRSAERQLLDYLGRKRMLLIIDNFEQLMDGVELLARIHHSAPDVHILVTSRQKLILHGERLYGLPGLDYPEETGVAIKAEQLLADYSAADLFAATARRANPDFRLQDDETSLLIRICQLVDGLPLAVELAAGWTNVLSIKDIVAELEAGLSFLESDLTGLPDRHRSMEAVFEVTWRRLPEEEQSLFCQLCVFRGGFTRPAAAEVAGATLKQLATLANKALIQFDRGLDRYQIHRLLQQYGTGKLAAFPAVEDTVQKRHCAVYSATAAVWGEQLKGESQLEALAELEKESANMQAAWRRAMDNAWFANVDQAADGLNRFYLWRRRFRQGEGAGRLAEEALTQAIAARKQVEEAADLSRILARVRLWRSVFCSSEEANRLVNHSLEALESIELSAVDTRRERAFALQRAADLAFEKQHQIASRLYRKSLALYREIEDDWSVATNLTALGWLAAQHGEMAQAVQMGREALSLGRRIGDRKRTADALWLLGTVAIVREHVEEAHLLFGESLGLRQALGDHITDIATGPLDLGMTLTWTGWLAEAEAVRKETLALYEAQGQPRQIAMAHVHLGTSKIHTGDFEGATHHCRVGLGQCRELGDLRGAGIALFTLAGLALAEGNADQAESLARESIACLREVGDAAEIGWSLAVCSEAIRRRGYPLAAKQCLWEAFGTVTGVFGMVTNLLGITIYLNFLADDGRRQEAVELGALLGKLPIFRGSRAFLTLYENRFDESKAALPQSAVLEAEARGRARDLEVTVAEILAELKDELET